VEFLPDGRRLLTAGEFDGTALLWDLLAFGPPGFIAREDDIGTTEAEELWNSLAQPSAAGFHAVLRLAHAPACAVRLLRGRLRPVPAPRPGRIEELIHQLDASSQVDRENAARALEA